MRFVAWAMLIILVSSCRPFLERKYQVNRQWRFESREGYMTYMVKELGIKDSMIVYPDSMFVAMLFSLLVKNDISVYYGVMLNDSLEFRKSAFLAEDPRCVGRILNEIKGLSINDREPSDTSFIQESRLKAFQFRFLKDDTPVRHIGGSRASIILVYHFAQGTYFDPFYKEIMSFYESHADAFDVFVITTDAYQLIRGKAGRGN